LTYKNVIIYGMSGGLNCQGDENVRGFRKSFERQEVEAEQLQLTEGESIGESVAVVPVSREIVDGADIDDLVGDMFPKISEGVAVRTVLRYDDLLRMRKVFAWYARNNPGDSDVAWARELMKRMLRKGGSERYAKRK
jgi:hypothetical protein